MRAPFTEAGRNLYIHQVRAVDTSSTQNATTGNINKGTPLVLNLSSTAQPAAANGYTAGAEDGLQVILPSTAGANQTAHLQYGVLLNTVAPQQMGEVMVHGVCQAVFEIILTRAATSSAWASYASLNSNFMLSIDTANNAFATYTSLAANQFQPPCVLLDTIASAATLASTFTGTNSLASTLTSYCSTILARVFVRMM
jgi:hypothetical protein